MYECLEDLTRLLNGEKFYYVDSTAQRLTMKRRDGIDPWMYGAMSLTQRVFGKGRKITMLVKRTARQTPPEGEIRILDFGGPVETSSIFRTWLYLRVWWLWKLLQMAREIF